MKLNAALECRAVVHSANLDWVQSPMPNVERRMLERNGDEVARATSVVRYAPNSAFSPHTHSGGEEFLVLEGVFSDEMGDFPTGSYVRNPVGSSHRPQSRPGCTIFVKLWQMPAPDQAFVRTNIARTTDWRNDAPGERRLTLHETDHERVCVVELAAGNNSAPSEYRDGAELFVIQGTISDEHEDYEPGSWLRLPPGEQHTLNCKTTTRFLLKTGHLSDPPPLP